MKEQQLLLALILSFFLSLSLSCHDDNDDCCKCNQGEVFVAGQCHPSESVHNLGGTQLIASNSYVGIINGNYCVDTLIFVDDTSTIGNFGRFRLYVSIHLGGVQNVEDQFNSMISDNEFLSQTSTPICYLNGEPRYANLHFIIEPDSVLMNLKFWELGGEPGVFVDSCDIKFYKKH